MLQLCFHHRDSSPDFRQMLGRDIPLLRPRNDLFPCCSCGSFSLLELIHGLPSTSVMDTVDLLRAHGVRLDNTEKNTGKRAYCFNAFQRAVIPAVYKCPPGTGGGGVT